MAALSIPRPITASGIGDRWWETRWFAWFACLVSAIPLLWPPIPPLIDLPGHIGRYHIALDIGRSAALQRHWIYHWAMVGNLGVDLPAILLGRLVGVEAAAKWIVVAIPPLTVAALLWLSRESGGRVSPAAPLAFPLAYSFAFQFGFVNFALASALAIAALALWIRLGRQRRLRLRAAIFLPISCLLWLCHAFGWGMFGLFAFAVELVRLRQSGASWSRSVIFAALPCAVLTLPLIYMLASADGTGLGIGFVWIGKVFWVASLLRDRWPWYDIGCAIAILVFLWTAIRQPAFRFDAMAGAAARTGLLAFLILPYRLMGGAYVDMRMLAPAVAIALIAIRFRRDEERYAGLLAVCSTAFFLMRTATTTVAALLASNGQQQAIAAVAHIPRGAAVLVLADKVCDSSWDGKRLGHVAGIGIVRRDIYENGEWMLAGQQLLRDRHPDAAPYRGDPSQLVYPARCKSGPTEFRRAIRDFDRDTFDHVWTLGFPPRAELASDVTLIWSNAVSSLYRVEGGLPERPAPH